MAINSSDKKDKLRLKFASENPTFMKHKEEVVVRKVSESMQRNAFEEARKRFEKQLMSQKQKDEEIMSLMN